VERYVGWKQKGKECCLRAKINMQDKNGAMRDPAIARVVDKPHAKTGTKFKVFPMYDLACPIVDSLEGVTHALRSSEYHDRNPLYHWIIEKLNLRPVHLEDFSRLNFTFTLLSKRKLQWFVDNNHVSGWDDPRFPTIQGILRRGMTVEVLRQYIMSQGASKAMNLMDPTKLWTANKQYIDPVVPRYTAIDDSKKVEVEVTNFAQYNEGDNNDYFKSIPRHKKNPDLGNKVLRFSRLFYVEGADAELLKEGEEFTLMDWGNAIIEKKNFGKWKNC